MLGLRGQRRPVIAPKIFCRLCKNGQSGEGKAGSHCLLEHVGSVLLFVYLLHRTLYVVSQYTGWTKIVSHYRIVSKSY